MTQPSYLFYDIESSGLSKPFDQVLQFAAIRTDLELNELEREEFLVKPNCDCVPAPEATITHGISMAKAREQGISEYQAILRIHNMLNKPGTISLGYNTLGFDDEFLRFSFWRNLLPPYTHQFGQCSRMDLYPMVIFYFLFNPEVIKWPELNGRPSLKLEQLSQINQLAIGNAHDAMVDVEATIALARKLATEPAMWSYLQGCFVKTKEQQRLQKLPTITIGNQKHSVGLMLAGNFGHKALYQAPVLSLGSHRHYKNQACWLRLDLPELANTTMDTLNKSTWVLRKKLGEPGFILPFNAHYSRHLSSDRQQIIQENINWCQQNPKLITAIQNHHLEYKYPLVPEADVEAALYQTGFLSPKDQKLCATFHQRQPNNKLECLQHADNLDLTNLGIRLIGRLDPKLLPAHHFEQFHDYLNKILHAKADQAPVDYKQQHRTTIPTALAKIKELQATELTASEQLLLSELQEDLQQRQQQNK